MCSCGLNEARNTDSNLQNGWKSDGSGKTIFRNTSKKIYVCRDFSGQIICKSISRFFVKLLKTDTQTSSDVFRRTTMTSNVTLFLRNHATLHLLWLNYQIWIRYMTQVFFLCEELNNVYNSLEVIRLALLVLTFCCKTSIQLLIRSVH